MKFLIVLACLVAAASASGLIGGYGIGHGVVTTGYGNITKNKLNLYFIDLFKFDLF